MADRKNGKRKVGMPPKYAGVRLDWNRLHPAQNRWLKKKVGRRKGIGPNDVLRDLVWAAMKADGVDVDAILLEK